MYNTILILTLIINGHSTIETINLGDGAISECQAIGVKWAEDMMSNNSPKEGGLYRATKDPVIAHYICSGWTDDGRNLVDGALGDRIR